MATLGKKPDLLNRAIRIMETAIKLWKTGYTTKSPAVDQDDHPVNPSGPEATAWRFDGGLIAATATEAARDHITAFPDEIDSTVALSHPWCGTSLQTNASRKSVTEAISMTQRVIEMLKRDQERQQAYKASRDQISTA